MKQVCKIERIVNRLGELLLIVLPYLTITLVCNGYERRGYLAIGGEAMIVIFGTMSALAMTHYKGELNED